MGKDKSKRILVITRQLTGGGAERVATDLATKLSKKYDTRLLVIDGSVNTYGYTVPTIDLKMSLTNKGFKPLWHLKLIYNVVKIKKKYRITHAISFLAEPDLANVLTKRYSKAIISIRNKRSAAKNKLLKKKDGWVFRHADYVVSLSEMVKADLICNFSVDDKKVRAIYNPCNKLEIQNQAKEVITSEKDINIYQNSDKIAVTAGRLEYQKGQWHLIRAFKKVIDQIPDAKLLILGQGSKREYLQQLIKSYNLEDSVYLLGYKRNPYAYMKKADMFVFSSLFEGLGNILIEAMACGLPIISTDCQYGPRELLAPTTDFTQQTKEIEYAEYGVLVPPMDGEEISSDTQLSDSENNLACAIIELFRNQSMIDEYKSKSLIRGEDFLPEYILDQWVEVVEEI